MKNDFAVIFVTAALIIIFPSLATKLPSSSLMYAVTFSIIVFSLIPIMYLLRKRIYGENLKQGRIPRSTFMLGWLFLAWLALIQRFPDFSWMHVGMAAFTVVCLFFVLWDGFKDGVIREVKKGPYDK